MRSSIADTTITYNVRGQKLSLTDPDTGTTTYSYNSAGELLTQTDAAGRITSSTYDNLGRILTRTQPNTTWFYDSLDGSANGATCGAISRGKLCRIESSEANTSYAYDSLGRPTTTSQQITLTGKNYHHSVSYDNQSRVKRIAYPITGLTLQHNYNAVGYLESITEPANNNKAHWQALTRHNDGQLHQMQYGGGIFTSTRTFDNQGRIATIFTNGTGGTGNSGTIQNASFGFDAIGNLTSRADSATGTNLTQETFTYDGLNRLIAQNGATSRVYSYDSFGNLKTRTDTGTLTYYPNTHRLQSVSGATTVGYSYNLAGDVTQITGGTVNGGQTRTITPNAFSLPSQITQGSTTIQYGYDGNRSRTWERRPNVPAGSSSANHINLTTYLLAGSSALFEEDRLGAGTVAEPYRYRYKHTIVSPEGAIGQIVIDAPGGGNPNQTRSDKSFHRDHLGSTVAVSDEAGTEYLGYDAWGKRRNPNGTDNAAANNNPGSLSSKTDRGYTNHEHIDDIGLIHMNGRLYDPYTGRMLSADPFIQAPYMLQNYNRYSYVMNNPLSLTDPSGHFWQYVVAAMVGAGVARATGVISPQQFRQVMAIGVGFLLGPLGPLGAIGEHAIVQTMIAGFAAGGIAGGNIESAVAGAASAAMFYGVGEVSGMHTAGVDKSFGSNAHIMQTIGHAAVGCAQSSVMGGSCGSGAAGSGFAAAAGPLLPGADISPERFFARVIVGGTASKLSGGSFSNGGFTAAFAYLFNDVWNATRLSMQADRVCNAGPTNACLAAQDSAKKEWADVPKSQALQLSTPEIEVAGAVGAVKLLIRSLVTGLGDLTFLEVRQIQSVVDQAGRPLEVIGSAARGARRPGSDIDYIVSPSSQSAYSGLSSRLPSLDPSHGLLSGFGNPFQGSVIRFTPGAKPTHVSKPPGG